MTWLILAELAVTVLAASLFIVVFGDPRRKADRTIAWHLWSFAALTALADGSLLLLALGVPVPLVVFALAYAGQAGLAIWRLVLAVQGRRAGRRPTLLGVSDVHSFSEVDPGARG